MQPQRNVLVGEQADIRAKLPRVTVAPGGNYYLTNQCPFTPSLRDCVRAPPLLLNTLSHAQHTAASASALIQKTGDSFNKTRVKRLLSANFQQDTWRQRSSPPPSRPLYLCCCLLPVIPSQVNHYLVRAIVIVSEVNDLLCWPSLLSCSWSWNLLCSWCSWYMDGSCR